MAIISLGKLDKSLIPIIIGCIFCFFDRLLNQFDGTLLFSNAILSNIVFSFARFFAIIPYIIVKIRTKNSIKEQASFKNNDNNVELIVTYNKIIKTQIKYIIIASLILFIQSLSFVISFDIKTSSWILYILFSSVFYYFIFKEKFYRHHFLSIALIILIGFIIDLITGNLIDDFKNNLLILLLRFTTELIFSFHNVFAKFIMEKKYVSVYLFLFIDSVINLILLSIAAIIDYNFIGFYDYSEYFNSFNSTELLVILGEIATQFGFFIFLFITIKNKTPSHAFILFVFGQFAYIYSSGITVIVFVCLFLILFLCLVIIEVIEINFCGLSYNIKRNIILRANIEASGSYFLNRESMDEISESSISLSNMKDDEIYN